TCTLRLPRAASVVVICTVFEPLASTVHKLVSMESASKPSHKRRPAESQRDSPKKPGPSAPPVPLPPLPPVDGFPPVPPCTPPVLVPPPFSDPLPDSPPVAFALPPFAGALASLPQPATPTHPITTGTDRTQLEILRFVTGATIAHPRSEPRAFLPLLAVAAQDATDQLRV